MRPHSLITALLLPVAASAQEKPNPRVQLDSSKPVPSRAEVLAAWQRRQDRITSFRFEWTEEQQYPSTWIANPRYPERERSALPSVLADRAYTVSKFVAVSGSRMRYGYTFDRPEEADGIRVTSPTGNTQGLGVHRNYTYLTTYDGQRSVTRITTLLDAPPPAVMTSATSPDAQNLDLRPFFLLYRPFDAMLGDLLLDRAVTSGMRIFHEGRSTFWLEERHDPTGWKTLRRIEPERDFIVVQLIVLFEQRPIVTMDIDYDRDARWGYVPRGWRVTEMLPDGTRKLVTTAKVSRYEINQPMPDELFR